MWMSDVSQKSAGIPSSRGCERTQDSAAWADSFITSPSCPVSVRLWVPFMRVASMKSRSPPAGVHASPATTPGIRVRSSSSSYSKRGTPRYDVTESGVIVAAAAGDLPADAADLTLEISHAGLPGVAPGEETHGLGCERHVGAVGQPVL